MGALLYIPLYVNRFAKPGILTVILIALYGFSDEFHQYFIPKRAFDLYDLLADTIGAMIAVIVMRQFIRLCRKGEKKTGEPGVITP